MVGFGVWLFGAGFFSSTSAKENIDSLCPFSILLTPAKQTSGDVRAGKSKSLNLFLHLGNVPPQECSPPINLSQKKIHFPCFPCSKGLIQSDPNSANQMFLHEASFRNEPQLEATVHNPFPRKDGSWCPAFRGNSSVSCAVASRPGGSRRGPLWSQPEGWLVWALFWLPYLQDWLSGPPGDFEIVSISFNEVFFCLKDGERYNAHGALRGLQAPASSIPSVGVPPPHRAFVPVSSGLVVSCLRPPCQLFPQLGMFFPCSNPGSLLNSKHSSGLTRLRPPHTHLPGILYLPFMVLITTEIKYLVS